MSEVSARATQISPRSLDDAISAATDALLAVQRPDGHWVFELEADATIPAEYVLMRHYLGEPVDAELEAKIATYLRRRQGAHDGWPLVQDGDFDMSASVKAYFALKMIGDDIEAPHMRRARSAIRARGGAAQSNVFTRAPAVSTSQEESFRRFSDQHELVYAFRMSKREYQSPISSDRVPDNVSLR